MSQLRSPVATFEPTRLSRRAACVVFWMTAATLAGCSGTTGHENLPLPQTSSNADEAGVDSTASDAANEGGGGDDATVDQSAGDDGGDMFDVTIQYADRPLPDVHVPPETGGGGDAGAEGGGWPYCPPDLPALLADDGGVTPVALGMGGALNADYEIPASFTADGGVIPAPAGDPCATPVYLGAAACDVCAKQNAIQSGLGVWGPDQAMLPPCSDLLNAGKAAVGPGAGQPLHDLCLQLYECLLTSGCVRASVVAKNTTLGPCICNHASLSTCAQSGGDGVCYQQELAALQIPTNAAPGDQFSQVVKNLFDIVSSYKAGAGVNTMFRSLQDMSPQCGQDCPVLTGVGADQ